MARCTLKVDGKYYLKDKSCPFHKEDDGSFTIGVSDKHRSKYFAYVTLEDKIATGKWNGPDGESHADEDLGTLKNVGNGCWSNERAEVCVK